jgi:DNA replication protein
MKEFKGFPARMEFTPVPNPVFSAILPEISDITELKVMLYIFQLVYPKKGNIRFVSFSEMANAPGLRNSIKDYTPEGLKKALAALVDKQIILNLELTKRDQSETIYFINNEANKTTIEKIQSGELKLPEMEYRKNLPAPSEQVSDIFTLYEENIGMLTPLIADELKEAEKQYPEAWIREAIKESVSLNKRNWRYIARILEHWSAEGKDDGTYRGHPKKNTDPDKYIRGKYGHMVQR